MPAVENGADVMVPLRNADVGESVSQGPGPVGDLNEHPSLRERSPMQVIPEEAEMEVSTDRGTDDASSVPEPAPEEGGSDVSETSRSSAFKARKQSESQSPAQAAAAS
eukprot:2696588-Amphidinium_carterae.1